MFFEVKIWSFGFSARNCSVFTLKNCQILVFIVKLRPNLSFQGQHFGFQFNILGFIPNSSKGWLFKVKMCRNSGYLMSKFWLFNVEIVQLLGKHMIALMIVFDWLATIIAFEFNWTDIHCQMMPQFDSPVTSHAAGCTANAIGMTSQRRHQCGLFTTPKKNETFRFHSLHWFHLRKEKRSQGFRLEAIDSGVDAILIYGYRQRRRRAARTMAHNKWTNKATQTSTNHSSSSPVTHFHHVFVAFFHFHLLTQTN